MRRRTFVASGVGIGAALLAGCTADGGSVGSSDGTSGNGSVDTGDSSDGDSNDDNSGVSGNTGSFRLLISDRPAAIGDFDSLTVSFSHARVFGGGSDETATATGSGDEAGARTDTESGTDTEGQTVTGTDSEGGGAVQPESDEEEDGDGRGNGNGNRNRNGDDEEEKQREDEDRDDGEERDSGDAGFTTFDLSGASVDLTRVVGDAAMSILDEPLTAGRYTKIELHAADVTGVVDGEEANVKIPSGKLMLTKPFEVVAGESVSFVFDINVVQRGQGNDHNLLPVIGESGVAGRDVEVEEVDDAGTAPNGTEASTATDSGSTAGTRTDTAATSDD